MALLVTPGQLARRAEFYHQFGQLMNAGIGILQAIEVLRRSPPDRSMRFPLIRMRQFLEQGGTFTEAARNAGAWLPAFDAALLEAGEKSGRLPACFELLARYYQERSHLTRDMLSHLLYPVFLVHFAVLILPLPTLLLAGGFGGYLRQIAGILLPIYAVVLLLNYASQGRHGESWRGFIERICRWVPVLGGARRDLALARLTAALEALLSAGVNIIEAWELAAAASGSPALRRVVRAWRPRLDAAATPSEVVTSSGAFPELFANMYHTGEISGQLDTTLKRLHDYYQDSASRKLKALAQWTPRLVYLMVALAIAYRVVSFWASYYDQIFKLIQ